MLERQNIIYIYLEEVNSLYPKSTYKDDFDIDYKLVAFTCTRGMNFLV